MKQTTKFLKLLCVLALFLSSKTIMAQCSVSFAYTVNPGGVVSFSAIPTTSLDLVSWNFGNGVIQQSYTPTLALTTSVTYTANGNYLITLNAALGSCSATSTQTINVTVSSGTVCNLVAGIGSQVINNGQVSFFNLTTGTVNAFTSYTVDYGNGTTGPLYSPYTYTANGVYTAILTAEVTMTPACTSTASTTFTVNTVCTSPLNVTLTGVQSSGNLTVSAAATGTVAGASYAWSIYDAGIITNTTTSSSEITYIASANGPVSFYVDVTNPMPSCTASASHTINVNTSNNCNLVVGFDENQTQGSVVGFFSTSTGVGSGATYTWHFGDGAMGSGVTPTHTYAANGTYTVKLVVNNNVIPTCIDSLEFPVVVNSGCYYNAGFTYTQNTNGNVAFTNTTGNYTAVTMSWDFGDGNTSNAINPSHTFASGTYTVELAVSGTTWTPWCADTTSQVLVITNTCVANASFSMVPSGTPGYWYAVPGSTVGVANASWSWGDGSSSTGLFSSHTYSAAGTYSICLTVTLTCGDVDTFCYNAAISKSAQNNGIIQVEVIDASNIATGIKNNSNKDVAYNVSPNPSTGLLNVNINGLTSAKAKINVYNLVGKLVYESENETSNGSLVKEINLDNMSNGVYFIKVSADNKTYTKKLVINK